MGKEGKSDLSTPGGNRSREVGGQGGEGLLDAPPLGKTNPSGLFLGLATGLAPCVPGTQEAFGIFKMPYPDQHYAY